MHLIPTVDRGGPGDHLSVDQTHPVKTTREYAQRSKHITSGNPHAPVEYWGVEETLDRGFSVPTRVVGTNVVHGHCLTRPHL